MTADSNLTFQQSIEGNRMLRLAWGTASARPITIAFWSQHFRTGIYSVSVNNQAGDRCYVTSYTHNASDVPQYNVVTIPGCTDGVWKNDNSVGMTIVFTAASGTNYITSTPNAWGSAYKIAAPGQVNAVGATTDVFRFSGVAIFPGIYAPTAAQSPLIMRPFNEELQLCQRYYEKSYDYVNKAGWAMGAGSNGFILQHPNPSSAILFLMPFKVKKRASPTLAVYDGAGTPGACSYYNAGWFNGGTWGNIGPSATEYAIDLSLNSGGPSAPYFGVDFVADARI